MDRIYLMAKVIAKANEVFEDSNITAKWLGQPNISLGGQRPFDLIKTYKGIEKVSNILTRLKHGAHS